LPDQEPQRFSSSILNAGQRIALRVEYDGSPFSGWQAQPHLPNVSTVQQSLEAALARVAAARVVVHCAGRTDTGVHATAQWVHFDAPAARSLKAWIVGTNAQLPAQVRVVDGRPVPDDFHARHSARSRRYDYLIANTTVAPALMDRRGLWVREPLDAGRMHAAMQALLGERDFSAFRAAACQSRTPMRCLTEASARREGAWIRIRVEANAFLHHMVRNIVGSTLAVGLGERDGDWLAELLAGRDRTVAAATAPAHGLYLTGVRYPDHYGLAAPATPAFFPA
jgi:tRNA pseudouridine38-40 synthase